LDYKKIKEAKSNIGVGICGLLFAIGYYLETFHFKTNSKNLISVAAFPRIIGVMVALCATVMLIRGISAMRKIPKDARIAESMRAKNQKESGLLQVVEAIIVLLGAASVLKTFGFILTMPITMFLLFIILEKKESRNYKLYIILSIVAPTVLYFVFYYCFSSLLPMGILKPFLSKIL